MDDPLSKPFLIVPVSAETSFVLPHLILLLLFFLLATVLSALERSIRSLSPEDLNRMENKQGKRILVRCLQNTQRMQAAFVMAKYISLISMVMLCTIALRIAFYNSILVFAASAFAGMSLYFLSFVFSRALSARVANLVGHFGWLIIGIHSLLFPFTFLFKLLGSFFENKTDARPSSISINELSRALDLTGNELANSEEHKLMKGIVNFGNMDITRIMKPKMDIVAFDFNTGFVALIKQILDSGYSRVPVIRNDIDHIAGVLYIKDLLAHLDEPDQFNWQALLRPCFFIPENTKPDDLLREFQNKKTHLAIVVDEFGQTNGLVTLEDIIEEIVGEINDEFDEEEIAYSKLDDQNYIFDGKTSMNDFLRIIDRSEESLRDLKSDADTLSGFIIEQAGKFPKKNEKINWEYYTFTIESADSRRIKRVKVTIRKKTSSA